MSDFTPEQEQWLAALESGEWTQGQCYLWNEAEGTAKQGQANAASVEAVGSAEANVTVKKLTAEAEGLTRKFEAIDSLSVNARSHEEFRMSLETHLQQALASISAGKDVAKENAEVIASALRNANIDLVGGDGGLFEAFSKSLSLGKAVEGLAGKSPIVQDLMSRYLGVTAVEPAPAKLPGHGAGERVAPAIPDAGA